MRKCTARARRTYVKRSKVVIMIALHAIVLATMTLASYGLLKDPDYLDARRKGAETKITLKVVNDMGVVVSNATVNVFFGMNFRPRVMRLPEKPTRPVYSRQLEKLAAMKLKSA